MKKNNRCYRHAMRLIAAMTAAALVFTMSASATFAAEKILKDETVYLITEADGSCSDAIVSEHLKNVDVSGAINDVSNLKNIENVKGDEKFTRGADDSIVWQSEGNDIYYQGTIEKEAPVRLDIRYYLDGKEIEGSKLDGKSGDVKIEINYENTLSGAGSDVVFAALTGFMVDDGCFSDVSVSSGKIIDDGARKIVVAIAVPGISDIIDDPEGNIGISDKVTISGKANKFNISDMMTVVTCDFLGDTDTNGLSLNGIDGQIKALDSGANQLVDGAATLYNGVNLLAENAEKLSAGSSRLSKGAEELSTGSAAILNGSIALAAGSKQLSEALNINLGSMKTGVAELYDGSGRLCSGINALQTSIDGSASQKGLMDGAKSVSSGIKSLKDGAAQALNASAGYTNEAITKLKAMEDSASEEEKKEIESIINTLESALYCQNQIAVPDELVNGAASVAYGLEQVSAGIGGNDGLAAGSAALREGLGVLSVGIGKATADTGSLTSSAAALAEGAGELEAGQQQVDNGAKALASGMEEFESGTSQLIGGIGQLDSGALQLSQGTKKLYNEGIRKIVNLYESKLKGIVNNLESITSGGNYRTFTKLPDDMNGSVKFIYKTEIISETD